MAAPSVKKEAPADTDVIDVDTLDSCTDSLVDKDQPPELESRPELGILDADSLFDWQKDLPGSRASPTGQEPTSIDLGDSMLHARGNNEAIGGRMSKTEHENMIAQQKQAVTQFGSQLGLGNDDDLQHQDGAALNQDYLDAGPHKSFQRDLAYQKAEEEYDARKAEGALTSRQKREMLDIGMNYMEEKNRMSRRLGDVASDDEDLQVSDVYHDDCVDNSDKNDTESPIFVQDTRKRRLVSGELVSSDEGEERPPKVSKSSEGTTSRERCQKAEKTTRVSKGIRRGKADGRISLREAIRSTNIVADAAAAETNAVGQARWSKDDVKDNRGKALKIIMNNLTWDQKKACRGDKAMLDRACKDFIGQRTVTPADGGMWRVRGMNTPLSAAQIISTAFMRRRESGEDGGAPSGILADTMGLGKTLITLANIVNGRPNPSVLGTGPIPEDQLYTTLVVVPSSLLHQWIEETSKHVCKTMRGKGWGVGARLTYREQDSEFKGPEDLQVHDIVFATYHEVIKSWPKIKAPDLEGEERELWYRERFDPKRGLLHRTEFLRVCIDEAHALRNPSSALFEACKGLSAAHHWAITGTPLVNGTHDLYALFDFIGHPLVRDGDQAAFRKRFCDKKDAMSVDHLTGDLLKYMCRSTHRNTLFGARLLTLPKVRTRTLNLRFDRFERTIYDIVLERFKERVQRMSDEGVLTSKATHIWTLILRLRQLTAHPLMIQGDICACLEREDLERLEDVVKKEAARARDGHQQIISLRNLLARERPKKENELSARGPADDEDGADEQDTITMPEDLLENRVTGAAHNSGRGHGKNIRMGKYLDAIKGSKGFADMNRRTFCSVCDSMPKDPHITSCFHIACRKCLEEAGHDAAARGQDSNTCPKCDRVMTARPLDGVDDEDDENQDNSSRRARSKDGEMQDWLDLKGEMLPSTKTIAAKAQILNWLEEDPTTKVVIYTQWIKMVYVLTGMCKTEEWPSVTLTGLQSSKAKAASLERFKKDSEVRVLISSLKCGGLGLNLTQASKVIIVDPWWNEATEQQAFARVFRWGQARETEMVQFRMLDSIDERLFQLKEQKKKEIGRVMSNHSEAKKLSVKELLSVFTDKGDNSDAPDDEADEE